MTDGLNKNEISVFEWQSQSPDLNPIEFLCDKISRFIYRYLINIDGIQRICKGEYLTVKS